MAKERGKERQSSEAVVEISLLTSNPRICWFIHLRFYLFPEGEMGLLKSIGITICIVFCILWLGKMLLWGWIYLQKLKLLVILDTSLLHLTCSRDWDR